MLDRSDLRAAIDAGILSAETAARLEAFAAQRHGGAVETVEGESLRFLANFNDIFISIGIVLLLGGIATFASAVFIGSAPSVTGVLIALAIPALSAWALSEYFCARRRLLLPSIVLCAAFCALVGIGISIAFGSANAETMQSFTGAFRTLGNLGLVGGGATGLAAAIYFVRFRLPFSLFVLALSLAAMAYAGMAFFGDTQMVMGGTLALLVGLATLAAAIWLDIGDPMRASRRSDFGFWLHLAAAPQIILGLRGMTLGFFGQSETIVTAVILLGSLMLFAVLSLALNRRALIVSSLLTYGLALTTLAGELGLGTMNTVIFTLLVLGGAVVLIGGGWSTARTIVLRVVPRGGLFDRVFPPQQAVLSRA